MSRILVTDGDERSALATVRSLGRAGHRVYVTAHRRGSLAGASRYAADEAQVPKPDQDPNACVETVRDLVGSWGVDLIIPIAETSIHALLPVRRQLAGARIPGPDYESFRAVCDKARLMDVARSMGIPTPHQVRIESPDERSEALGRVEFPAVLKPAHSVVSAKEGYRKTNVQHVSNTREMDEALDGLPAEAFPVLIQERIVGDGTGVFLLRWDRRLLAAFCHRRLREKPPSGGVSVLRESVPLDAQLVQRSLQLLSHFDWRGVAMVEYKRDAKSNRPYLMEVNGRFWGSLQLAVDAGVDFPRILVEAAIGSSPDSVTQYETGVRTRWLLGDIDHLLLRLSRSDRELSLPADAPSRGRAVLDFLASCGPAVRNEVLRWNDPHPALRESVTWLRGWK